MEHLDASYWDQRYVNHDHRWDLGQVSPPLKTYINQLDDTSLRILIPGGGNSYEAEYLYYQGFKNVYVVDLSKTALQNFKSRVANFPSEQLIQSNFFELDLTFDIIIEQTFFCALQPNLRIAYVEKMYELLSENGKLVGLLFNQMLNDDRPPFGGNKKMYIDFFEAKFYIQIMELCYNSIAQRQGNELFFKLEKK